MKHRIPLSVLAAALLVALSGCGSEPTGPDLSDLHISTFSCPPYCDTVAVDTTKH